MSMTPPLVAYPVFRLTLSMMVGIFLADLCLPGIRLIFLLLCICLMFMMICYKRQVTVFGMLACISFCLFGALRLLMERERIDYDWDAEQTTYVGEVMTPPVMKGKTYQSTVSVEAKITETGTYPVHRDVLLSWMPDSLQSPLKCGDRFLFAGMISMPVSEVAVTGFDYGRYLYRKGISGTGTIYQGNWMPVCKQPTSVLSRVTVRNVKQMALNCRDRIVTCYRGWQLGEEELAVVAALTIGDKSELSPTLKNIYSAAGVSHVLALSGLHVGILSAILYFISLPLKRMKRGESFRSILVVLILWIFAFISGLSPSVVRAVTMCSLYFLANCLLEERFPSVYVLVLAAFLMLSYQPFYLFDMSCQLSFLAVASILYFYPVLSGWVHFKQKFLNWVGKGIAVSASAQLGTLPLILFYFGTFPTYFLLANFIVSIVAVCVLGFAMAALLLFRIPYLGAWVIEGLKLSTYCMNTSIRWIQQLSGSQIEGLSMSMIQSACGFILLIETYFYIRKRRAFHLLLILLSVNVMLADWTFRPLQSQETTLYLYRKKLYLKQVQEVIELPSTNGLYEVDSLHIAILTDDQWKGKEATQRIPMDYLYICRGFRGTLSDLLRVFQVKQVVLDASLSRYYQELLQQECKERQIPCKHVSEKGSFQIGKTF